jgi:Flp pilus assembly protein TadB
MLIWVLVAAAWVVGVPPLIVGAGAVMVVNPPVGIAALVAAAFVARHRHRRAQRVDEVGFLRSIAAAVTAGSTLRSAIRDGDAAIVTARTRRLCDTGMPLARVGRSLRDSLPENGATFGAVCALSEQTGSTLAPTLHVLTRRAVDVADMERHRVVATAQARFSAIVVGVAPLVVTLVLIVMRGMPGDGNPVAVGSIIVGAGMQVAGVAAVSALASGSIA